MNIVLIIFLSGFISGIISYDSFKKLIATIMKYKNNKEEKGEM